jgi:hypothetical protein
MGTCAYGFKFVVAVADGLHLFVLRVPVEWRVSAEQKVAVRARQATGRETTGTLRRLRDDSGRPNINWLSVPGLLEDLRLSQSQHPASRSSCPRHEFR